MKTAINHLFRTTFALTFIAAVSAQQPYLLLQDVADIGLIFILLMIIRHLSIAATVLGCSSVRRIAQNDKTPWYYLCTDKSRGRFAQLLPLSFPMSVRAGSGELASFSLHHLAQRYRSKYYVGHAFMMAVFLHYLMAVIACGGLANAALFSALAVLMARRFLLAEERMADEAAFLSCEPDDVAHTLNERRMISAPAVRSGNWFRFVWLRTATEPGASRRAAYFAIWLAAAVSASPFGILLLGIGLLLLLAEFGFEGSVAVLVPLGFLVIAYPNDIARGILRLLRIRAPYFDLTGPSMSSPVRVVLWSRQVSRRLSHLQGRFPRFLQPRSKSPEDTLIGQISFFMTALTAALWVAFPIMVGTTEVGGPYQRDIAARAKYLSSMPETTDRLIAIIGEMTPDSRRQTKEEVIDLLVDSQLSRNYLPYYSLNAVHDSVGRLQEGLLFILGSTPVMMYTDEVYLDIAASFVIVRDADGEHVETLLLANRVGRFHYQHVVVGTEEYLTLVSKAAWRKSAAQESQWEPVLHPALTTGSVILRLMEHWWPSGVAWLTIAASNLFLLRWRSR